MKLLLNAGRVSAQLMVVAPGSWPNACILTSFTLDLILMETINNNGWAFPAKADLESLELLSVSMLLVGNSSTARCLMGKNDWSRFMWLARQRRQRNDSCYYNYSDWKWPLVWNELAAIRSKPLALLEYVSSYLLWTSTSWRPNNSSSPLYGLNYPKENT